MTKMTKGWTRVAFGEVVQLCRERSSDPSEEGFERYLGLDHLEPGDLKIRRWGNVSDGTTFTNIFRAGQVLFGKRRAYQRKVAIADFEGVCSSDIYVLEPKNQRLLPKLLPFICQSDRFFEHAVGTSAGSLSPRTNWESLAKYEFVLPPLEEQLRMADALNAVQSCVQSLISANRAIQAVMRSLAAQLILEPPNGNGTPIGKFAKLDIETVKIEASKIYRTGGVLNEGKGLFARESLNSSKTRYSQMNRLRTDQVVMRKLTAWEGAIAIVLPEFDGFLVSAEFPTLTLDLTHVMPSFLSWVFQQSWFWSRMKAGCRGTAVRRSRLHPKDLLSIQIDLPPIDKQREIQEKLSCVRSQIRAIAQRLTEAREIGKSLLEQLMGDHSGHRE